MNVESLMTSLDVNVPGNQNKPVGPGQSNRAIESTDKVAVQAADKAQPAKVPEQQAAQEAAAKPSPAMQDKVLEKDQLEAMAQKLQEFVGDLNKGLEFSVDEDSGRDVIKVIDRESGDIVRQYPSEEVLDLIATLSDAAGTFVNTKA